MTEDPRANADTPPADVDYEQLLRDLADVAARLLERAEPVLRRAAAGVAADEWAGCGWCPVCAALALLRGEHHDLLATLADHGVTVVTVLREALAGTPVDPVQPEDMPADPPPRARRRAGAAPAAGCGPQPWTYQPIRVAVR